MVAQAQTTKKAPPAYKARLGSLFKEQYAPELKGQLGLKSLHQVPRLEKVIVSVGLGKAKDDKKLIDVAENTLMKISGQKPVKTLSKKAIAAFKLRQGVVIGLKVSLRGQRMYEFADRLVNLVLPRLRDFHGLSNKSFDSQGNYTIGLADQTVFPELTYEDTAIPHGLEITFNISSSSVEQSKALLEKLGMPFEKERSQ
ncbi:50S ribosomal protein L5 [Candidatus Saccharibacteria bacterium RIFCSPHIGHO2_12_FULL_47_16b]|nr:MAG: 50S ribosomal protein L5 [Candidatus Saccharibacteria bacterium RIFCSPHIGHO2_12_FULL_47_16b]OGL39370.1 MAG: 50S ribosomal protein L5 [Candidatus Saccharibacteria bacterium RIFCSPLOWO2_02_FULL_46_7]